MTGSPRFDEILARVARDDATAEDVVDAVADLSSARYEKDLARYLMTRFGTTPKLTRILVRAAGRSKSPVVHDVLADRLMDPACGDYRFELIDALAQTGSPGYAAVVVPFLSSRQPDAVRTTAAHALGVLGSPLAVLPLIRQFRTSRSPRLKALVVESLRRILGNHRLRAGLDVYLASTSRKTGEEIRAELSGAS